MHRGRPSNRARAALLVVLAALAVPAFAFAPAAMAGVITPEDGGSPNADSISNLYTITFAIGVVIFLIVEGTLLWSLFRYRYRRGGPEPEQIRGNTPLEVGWTIGAATILLVLTAVTFIYLDDIRNPQESGPEGLQFAAVNQPAPPGGESLEIQVNGQQYIWRYEYPEGVFSYHEMVVPEDTTVTLKITASDVVHSWWIPKLGGKADAVPGHTNETWFKAPGPAVYRGACAELCGDGHADMRAKVTVLSVAEYEEWLEEQRQGIRESRELLPRQRLSREDAEATDEDTEPTEQ